MAWSRRLPSTVTHQWTQVRPTICLATSPYAFPFARVIKRGDSRMIQHAGPQSGKNPPFCLKLVLKMVLISLHALRSLHLLARHQNSINQKRYYGFGWLSLLTSNPMLNNFILINNNHDIVRYNVPLALSQSLRCLPNRKSLRSLAVFLVLFLNLCLFSKKKKRYGEKKTEKISTLQVLCLLEKTIKIIMLMAAGTLRQIVAVLPQLWWFSPP